MTRRERELFDARLAAQQPLHELSYLAGRAEQLVEFPDTLRELEFIRELPVMLRRLRNELHDALWGGWSNDGGSAGGDVGVEARVDAPPALRVIPEPAGELPYPLSPLASRRVDP